MIMAISIAIVSLFTSMMSIIVPGLFAGVIATICYVAGILHGVLDLFSGMISGFPPYKKDGTLDLENIKKSMEYLANQGVKDKIIVHCKQAGFCYDVSTNTFTTVPSLNIPNSEIKGSVGAGDAFCAGALYGIYNKFDDQSMLEFASSSAACNLFSDTSVDGMKTKEEIEKLEQIYGRKEL